MSTSTSWKQILLFIGEPLKFYLTPGSNIAVLRFKLTFFLEYGILYLVKFGKADLFRVTNTNLKNREVMKELAPFPKLIQA